MCWEAYSRQDINLYIQFLENKDARAVRIKSEFELGGIECENSLSYGLHHDHR